MINNELLWNMFEKTGSVDLYLMYKECDDSDVCVQQGQLYDQPSIQNITQTNTMCTIAEQF